MKEETKNVVNIYYFIHVILDKNLQYTFLCITKLPFIVE